LIGTVPLTPMPSVKQGQVVRDLEVEVQVHAPVHDADVFGAERTDAEITTLAHGALEDRREPGVDGYTLQRITALGTMQRLRLREVGVDLLFEHGGTHDVDLLSKLLDLSG
jgi:GTP cyclohydrolase II